MLMRMLQLIGKHIVEDKSPIEVLVDEQKEYKSNFILIVGINPFADNFVKNPIRIEDYDNKKRYDYLRGTVGSGGSNFSPTMNISLQKLKTHELSQEISEEDIKTADDWIGYLTGKNPELLEAIKSAINIEQNITKSLRKDPLKDRNNDSIEKATFLWLDKYLDEMTIYIFSYLIGDFISFDGTSIKIDNSAPNSIIFEIKIDDEWRLPGTIEEFRQLYLDLVDDKIDNLNHPSICYICNKKTKKLLQPSIGIFNLNMQGFVQGFFKEKDAIQYSVCSSCNREIKSGFDYIESNLKFYAYRTKKGVIDKDGVYINHYFIPVTTSPNLLIDTIRRIKDAKIDIGEGRKQSYTQQIEKLNDKINKASGSRKRKLKNEIRKLKNELDKDPEDLATRAETIELLNSLQNLKMNYYDIYFHETDLKQNPSTKEVVGYYQITYPVVRKIVAALDNVNNHKFSIYQMRFIISGKLFLSLLQAIFTSNIVRRDQFLKETENTIMLSFNNKLLKLEKEDIKSTSYLISVFKDSYQFLTHAGVLTA